MPFGNLQAGCHVPFTEERLLSGHSTVKARLVECCRNECLSGSLSHLHRVTLELCQSGLPDEGPSPPITQFDRAASSRKSLGGSKLLPFKNDGGHCVIGELQSCFGTLAQIFASTQSCLGALGQFLRP